MSEYAGLLDTIAEAIGSKSDAKTVLYAIRRNSEWVLIKKSDVEGASISLETSEGEELMEILSVNTCDSPSLYEKEVRCLASAILSSKKIEIAPRGTMAMNKLLRQMQVALCQWMPYGWYGNMEMLEDFVHVPGGRERVKRLIDAASASQSLADLFAQGTSLGGGCCLEHGDLDALQEVEE